MNEWRDIDGRPLRVGDKVQLVGPCVKHEFRGDIHRIVGPARPEYELIRILITRGKPEVCVQLDDMGHISCDQCRRIDDRPELSEWGEIEQNLGWRPERTTA